MAIEIGDGVGTCLSPESVQKVERRPLKGRVVAMTHVSINKGRLVIKQERVGQNKAVTEHRS